MMEYKAAFLRARKRKRGIGEFQVDRHLLGKDNLAIKPPKENL